MGSKNASSQEVTFLCLRIYQLVTEEDCQRCWDEQGLEKKFRWLARHVLDETCVDAVAEMVWRFEDVSNVRELTRLLA